MPVPTVKLLKMAKFFAKIAVPLVVVLLILNLIVLLQLHNNQTTMIFSEVYNKKSDRTSNSDHPRGVLNNKLIYNDKIVSEKSNPVKGDEKLKKSDAEDKHKNQKEALKKQNEAFIMKDSLVDAMIEKLTRSKLNPFIPDMFWNTTLYKLARILGRAARTSASKLNDYQTMSQSGELPTYKKVHSNIRRYSLYDPDDQNVDALLHDLATLPIEEAEENDGGTEIKLNIRFNDSGRAILKPMRNPRSQEANPNHYVFDDMERHHSEIAAFQLDRILGFYRVPPTIGRWINLTSEIEPLVPKEIKRTFYKSPIGSTCFYGRCDYYCDSRHPVCGNPHMIEASIMSYLPSRNRASRDSWYQPWRRSYSKFRKASWMKRDNYCDSVRIKAPFNNGKVLLDMIDVHTFDFITGNRDRHSFAFFEEWGNYSFPILYDNGRGFGRSDHDALSIMAPLVQCCMIRKSTFLKYLKLYMGPEKLSSLMEKALQNDPVAPVLKVEFLTAMDRRVVKLLQAVARCLHKHSLDKVIIYDKF